MAEQKGINAHSNQRNVTVEDNLNKKLDGLKNDFEHKWDNLQDSIENLIDQQQCPPEEECQSYTMVEEQCQQQPHQGLIEDFIELPEGLSESSDMCVVVFPREKREEILPFITEEGSGKETVEEPKELVLNPFPTYNPLPVALYPEPLHILLIPATHFTLERTGKTEASPSTLPVHNFRKLVATVQTFTITSKTSATTYTAWHSGWLKNLVQIWSTWTSAIPQAPPVSQAPANKA